MCAERPDLGSERLDLRSWRPKGAAVHLILSAFQSVDLTILSFCDFPGQILYHVPETNSSLFHLLTQSHAVIELNFFLLLILGELVVYVSVGLSIGLMVCLSVMKTFENPTENPAPIGLHDLVDLTDNFHKRRGCRC